MINKGGLRRQRVKRGKNASPNLRGTEGWGGGGLRATGGKKAVLFRGSLNVTGLKKRGWGQGPLVKKRSEEEKVRNGALSKG